VVGDDFATVGGDHYDVVFDYATMGGGCFNMVVDMRHRGRRQPRRGGRQLHRHGRLLGQLQCRLTCRPSAAAVVFDNCATSATINGWQASRVYGHASTAAAATTTTPITPTPPSTAAGTTRHTTKTRPWAATAKTALAPSRAAP
jgi:hypothetical protein